MVKGLVVLLDPHLVVDLVAIGDFYWAGLLVANLDVATADLSVEKSDQLLEKWTVDLKDMKLDTLKGSL